MNFDIRQPPDPLETFVLGTIVNEKSFVITINRKTFQVIVYSKLSPEKDPEPVANGTWSIKDLDIEDSSYNSDVLDDDALSDLLDAIRESEWLTLQHEPIQ